MSVPEDTYKAKNVLITGGAGFIASHVAILFAKKYPQYKCVKHAAASSPPTLRIAIAATMTPRPTPGSRADPRDRPTSPRRLRLP